MVRVYLLTYHPLEEPLSPAETALAAALAAQGAEVRVLRNGALVPALAGARPVRSAPVSACPGLDPGASEAASAPTSDPPADAVLQGDGVPLVAPDAVLMRTDACGAREEELYAARWFARRGPVINDPEAARRCRDKWNMLSTLARLDVAVPDTRLLRGDEHLDDHAAALGGFPLVLKRLYGSRGLGVTRADSPEALRSLLHWTWHFDRHAILLLQRYVPRDEGPELRVVVLADRVLGAVRRWPAPGDFRANAQAGARAEAVAVDEPVAVACRRAVAALALDYGAVDLRLTAAGPVLFEVNANPQFEQFSAATGVDVAAALAAHVIAVAARRAAPVRPALADFDAARRFLFAPGPAPVVPSPERLRRLRPALGLATLGARVIHVLGTNGKGSVVRMLDALLAAHGRRVARYTSPHLSRVNERIAVEGRDAADEELLAAARALAPVFADCDLREQWRRPCGFDLMTLAAFTHFARAGCDAWVVEAGLGGRLDATNCFAPRELAAAVLTNVTLDHTELLGGTVEAIGDDKLAAVPTETPLVSGVGGTLARRVREARPGGRTLILGEDFSVADVALTRAGARFTFAGFGRHYAGLEIGLPGAHQVENAALALAAFLVAAERLGLTADEAAVRRGLMAARSPGRLEWLPGAPSLLLDVAHNAAGADALAAYLRAFFAPGSLVLLGGVSTPKPATLVLGALFDRLGAMVLTEAGHRARPAAEIAAECRALGAAMPIEVEPDRARALTRARTLAGPGGCVLVAGSLFLVGDVRAAVAGEQ